MGHRFPSVILALTFAVVLLPRPADAELLSPEAPIADAIDHYVDARLNADGITRAEPATESVFLRRISLDLAGRIPTLYEAQSYVADEQSDKRVRLVDSLLAGPDFAYHQRNELDALLLARLKNDDAWRAYLLTATRENRSWGQLFREMMTSRDESAEKKNPALEFLRSRSQNVEEMANDTSALFFGVTINCAKCHDHPLVDDWKQDHFYGMTSFFSRTYVTKKQTLAERRSGKVTFKTTSGEEKKARFMFLSGASLEEPLRETTPEQLKAEEAEYKRQREDANAPLPDAPEFSPRAKLVEMALQSENSGFFSRSIVNRVWKRFLGLGLVDPPDQMHSGNEASHPELMQWLARDFVSHNYDLKRLIRGIVLSNAYSRTSSWQGEGEPPTDDYFGVAVTRPCSPRQYSLSLRIASTNPEAWPTSLMSEDWASMRESLETKSTEFAGQIELAGENFMVSVDEALLLSNGEQVQTQFLNEADDGLVGHLQTIEAVGELIDKAFWAVLTRAPSEEEQQVFQQYLKDRQDRRTEGIKQLVWVLISSPEMRFNH